MGLVLTTEDRLLREELGQYAACAPDVDSWSVVLLSQQKLRRPVPKRNHSIRVRTDDILLIETGETPIRYLQFSPVVNQDITAFDVPVQEFLRVTIIQSLDELFEERSHLIRLELRYPAVVDRRKQSSEVMVDVFENQVEIGHRTPRLVGVLLISDNVMELHHVHVIQLTEDFDLSDGSDRETFLLVIQAHLLKGDLFSCGFALRLVNLSIGSLSDLLPSDVLILHESTSPIVRLIDISDRLVQNNWLVVPPSRPREWDPRLRMSRCRR